MNSKTTKRTILTILSLFILASGITYGQDNKTAGEKAKINLKDYAGTFIGKDNFTIVFTVEDGKLFGEPQGTPKSELTYEEGDRFLVPAANKTLEFLREKNGKVDRVQFNFFGDDVIAVKAKPNLNDYVGTYEFKEVGDIVIVTVADGKLFGENQGQTIELVSKGGDEFEYTNPESGDVVPLKFFKDNNKKVNKLVVYLNGQELAGEKEVKK